MKKLIILFSMILFIFGISLRSMAYQNSGIYLGTFAGNDNQINEVFDKIIDSSYYDGNSFLFSDFDFYAKVDEPFSTETEGSGSLFLNYSSDNKSGTWATFADPAISGDLINFYSIKASNWYALYWVPADDQGTWSTENLSTNGGTQPSISHFSAWVLKSYPVPEPATMVLLGSGLLGLAVVGRKKFMKK